MQQSEVVPQQLHLSCDWKKKHKTVTCPRAHGPESAGPGGMIGMLKPYIYFSLVTRSSFRVVRTRSDLGSCEVWLSPPSYGRASKTRWMMQTRIYSASGGALQTAPAMSWGTSVLMDSLHFSVWLSVSVWPTMSRSCRLNINWMLQRIQFLLTLYISLWDLVWSLMSRFNGWMTYFGDMGNSPRRVKRIYSGCFSTKNRG